MNATNPALGKARIVVFDTESTGLNPIEDDIIEIAAMALEGGIETGRFETLIDPGRPIPPELTGIHGIDDAMVRGKARFAEAARGFLEFASDAILAAHNAPYDIAMMTGPLLQAGLRPVANPVLDTCRLARRLIEAPNYQLGTLAGILGIDISRAHRAMPDVEATARVLLECLTRMGPGATLADAEVTSAMKMRFGYVPPPQAPLPLTGGPDPLWIIARAMESRRPVEIVYQGGTHGTTPRAITPLFLIEVDGFPNVAAHCHIDGILKNFRIAQIESAASVQMPPR